jgi:transposase InsO family protein
MAFRPRWPAGRWGSRSWFYKHEDAALPPRRVQLKAEVRRLFAAHEGKYGSPRITADLRDEGWVVSKNTVAAVMRELGLAARRKKKRKEGTRAASTPPRTR